MGVVAGMRRNDVDLTLEDHPERRFEGNPFVPAPHKKSRPRRPCSVLPQLLAAEMAWLSLITTISTAFMNRRG